MDCKNDVKLHAVRENCDIFNGINECDKAYFVTAGKHEKDPTTKISLTTIVYVPRDPLSGKKRIIVKDPVEVGVQRVGKMTFGWFGEPDIMTYTNQLLAAHEGDTIAVVETNFSTYKQWLRFGVGKGKEEKRIKLPESAFNICISGSIVFLGLATSIGWVDFSVENPVYTEVCRRNKNQLRSHDILAMKHNLIVTVDSMRESFIAASFVFSASKQKGNKLSVSHNETRNLPGVINGSYFLTDITKNKELILAASFVDRSKSGQALLRLPILGMKHGPSCRLVKRTEIQIRHGRGDPDETMTRMSDNRIRRWESLAVRGDEILLAAGEQGLLSIPSNFGENTMATSINKFDDRGPVKAVRVVADGSTWILVDSESNTELINIDVCGNVLTTILLSEKNLRLLSAYSPNIDVSLIDSFKVNMASLDRKLKLKCLEILKNLQLHMYGYWFNYPINPIKQGLQGYYNVIKKPMDLGTIQRRLEMGFYNKIEEFISDVHLTFDNAINFYNGHTMAKILKSKFNCDLEKVFGWTETIANKKRRLNEQDTESED